MNKNLLTHIIRSWMDGWLLTYFMIACPRCLDSHFNDLQKIATKQISKQGNIEMIEASDILARQPG